MMCQEVIELMQRYLDRDLGETEYRRMLQHLQQCPDCTELFERLVNLSHELESLPKVTPPFSLVDAIMPTLEKLEATGGAPDLLLAQHTEAENDSRAAAAETTRETMSRRKSSGGWRKNAREWISFPIFGGVVAAGLVAGFFLFGQQSQSNSDAGKLLLSLPGTAKKSVSVEDTKAAGSNSGGSKQEPAAAGSLPNAKNNEAAGNMASPATGANNQAPAPDSNAAPKAQAPAAPAAAPDKAAPTTPAPDRQRTAETGGTAEQPKAAAAPKAEPSKPAEPPVAAGSAPPQPQAGSANEPKSLFAAPEPEQSQDTKGTGAAAVPGDKSANDQPPAEVAGPKAPEKKTQGDYGNRQQQPMGITAFPAATPAQVTELSTADGVYKAVIQDDKVTVYDKQGKAAYSSKYDWKDGNFKLELVDWSADYKLTYKVKASDQVRTFVIAMKDLTEMESKP